MNYVIHFCETPALSAQPEIVIWTRPETLSSYFWSMVQRRLTELSSVPCFFFPFFAYLNRFTLIFLLMKPSIKNIFVFEHSSGQKATLCQRVSQSDSKWPRKTRTDTHATKKKRCAKGYPYWFRNGRENREYTHTHTHTHTDRHFRIYISRDLFFTFIAQ